MDQPISSPTMVQKLEHWRELVQDCGINADKELNALAVTVQVMDEMKSLTVRTRCF